VTLGADFSTSSSPTQQCRWVLQSQASWASGPFYYYHYFPPPQDNNSQHTTNPRVCTTKWVLAKQTQVASLSLFRYIVPRKNSTHDNKKKRSSLLKGGGFFFPRENKRKWSFEFLGRCGDFFFILGSVSCISSSYFLMTSIFLFKRFRFYLAMRPALSSPDFVLERCRLWMLFLVIERDGQRDFLSVRRPFNGNRLVDFRTGKRASRRKNSV
jgi:hypothetical protein